MDKFKETQKEIHSKLRRGYRVDSERRDYVKDKYSPSTLVKKFPVVLDFELAKYVRSYMNHPRPEQKRICKHLYGHLSPYIWSLWVGMRDKIKGVK